MDKALLMQISKYAEDREIDYTAATVIGEQQGIVWKNEAQLVEFKQAIDMYLKTFDVQRLELVEATIKKFGGNTKPKVTSIGGGANAKTTEEAEELTHYAATEKQIRKPKSKQNVMKGKGKKRK